MNRRLLPLLLTLFTLVVALPGLAVADEAPAKSDEVAAIIGKPFADFIATTLENKTIDTAEIQGPFAISFFATWCPPCRIEMPELQRVATKYPATLTVLAIALDDPKNSDAVAEFIQDNGLSFPIIHKQELGEQFSIHMIPTLIYVGADHHVKDVGVGYGDGDGGHTFWDDFPLDAAPAIENPALSDMPGGPEIGARFPDIKIDSLSNGAIDTADIHTPFVVSFFATWCGPCQREMPELQQLATKHPDDLQVLAISVDEDVPEAEVRDWITGKGLTFPIALEGMGPLAEQFNVHGIPVLIYVGADHTILDIQEGYDTTHSSLFWQDFPVTKE